MLKNLKGALLVSLRTIWTFLNGLIRPYRKVVGISLTLPKLWCHGIISQYTIYFLLCFSVYMSLFVGFCFMNFQRLERIRVIQQVTFYLPKVTQFHYILQVVPLPHPDGRRSLGARYSLADSGSSESEEESEVSKDRLGRLPCSKLRNCYYVYVTNCVPVGKVEVEQMLYLCLMLSLEASCRWMFYLFHK